MDWIRNRKENKRKWITISSSPDKSSHLWYHNLGEMLKVMGFTQLRSDQSVYMWYNDSIHIILPFFVDNITIVSKDKTKISAVKEMLHKAFKIKDLGPASYLLGIKLDYDQENCILSCHNINISLTCLTNSNSATAIPSLCLWSQEYNSARHSA